MVISLKVFYNPGFSLVFKIPYKTSPVGDSLFVKLQGHIESMFFFHQFCKVEEVLLPLVCFSKQRSSFILDQISYKTPPLGNSLFVKLQRHIPICFLFFFVLFCFCFVVFICFTKWDKFYDCCLLFEAKTLFRIAFKS